MHQQPLERRATARNATLHRALRNAGIDGDLFVGLPRGRGARGRKRLNGRSDIQQALRRLQEAEKFERLAEDCETELRRAFYLVTAAQCRQKALEAKEIEPWSRVG